MRRMTSRAGLFVSVVGGGVLILTVLATPTPRPATAPSVTAMTVYAAAVHDRSPRLSSLVSETGAAGSPGCAGKASGCLGPPSGRPAASGDHERERDEAEQGSRIGAPAEPPRDALGAAVEQTTMGTKPAAALAESFDGLGVGFTGPQGPFTGNNPSDNSLAVGPDHIMQSVNTRMAVFTKKGKQVRHDRHHALGRRAEQHGVRRLRRHLSGDEQR